MSPSPIYRTSVAFSVSSTLKEGGSWAAFLAFFCLIACGCGLTGGEDTTPPEPPPGLSATSQDAAISLTWSASGAEDVAGYHVYRSTSSIREVSSLDPVNGDDPVKGASYTDDTVENGTTYRYVVTAVDQAGNESDPSGEVKKTPFATPPDRP